MNLWEQFKERAAERLGNALESAAPIGEGAQGINFGETIFDAMYQFGRGKSETAVERLTAAFRRTGTGQRIEREATQQRLTELMPFIIGGVVLLLGAVLLFKRG